MKAIIRPQSRFLGSLAALALLGSPAMLAQALSQAPVEATVDFGRKLQTWDGFGVNYVETCNVHDIHAYKKQPQEYGGFSTLSEKQRLEILDMVFGAEGLKPGLVKMFLDPLHTGPSLADKNNYDHEATTKWMRYFVREGLKLTRTRGGDLQIITTMWSPPQWGTKQKAYNGRDLDPEQKEAVAMYMIDWVKFLRNSDKFPVKYVSVHNEGEGWNRWPVDGTKPGHTPAHEYNMWWPSSQVVDFLRFMRPMMDREGLKEVALAPGETSNWEVFGRWYAWFIYSDPVASKNIGLISSHGFGNGRGFNNSLGIDTLHLVRPDLHAWNTSMNVAPNADNIWVENVRQNIYWAKVNGVIPWSIISSDAWPGGAANDTRTNWERWVGAAFWADRKGGYTVEPGYYLIKQVFRAGQPGMAVAEASSSDPDIGLIAFARNGTSNPDAVVVNNLAGRNRTVAIKVAGTGARSFEAFGTEVSRRGYYEPLGTISVSNGVLTCMVPAKSVITLFAK